MVGWETMPDWFWAILYLFLLITLGMAGFQIIRRKQRTSFSVIAILFTLLIPVISFFNSIGRADGMNEFEHLFDQLKQGEIWSIFCLAGYLYLFIWWVKLLLQLKNRRRAGV